MALPQRKPDKRAPRRAARKPVAESGEGSLFLPKEIPTLEALQAFGRQIPDLDLDADSLAAHLSLLHVVGRILAKADAYFSGFGLSKGRFSVLVMLFFLAREGASPSEIAEQTNVTRATITGLLDGLERDGLVRREKSGDDRRRLVVRLTRQGEKLMHAFLPLHFKRVSTLMGRLSREEKHELVRLLGKVRDALPDLEALL